MNVAQLAKYISSLLLTSAPLLGNWLADHGQASPDFHAGKVSFSKSDHLSRPLILKTVAPQKNFLWIPWLSLADMITCHLAFPADAISDSNIETNFLSVCKLSSHLDKISCCSYLIPIWSISIRITHIRVYKSVHLCDPYKRPAFLQQLPPPFAWKQKYQNLKIHKLKYRKYRKAGDKNPPLFPLLLSFCFPLTLRFVELDARLKLSLFLWPIWIWV